ncbi:MULTISPECIES: cystathionine gamma-synthase family protein [unclassified Spirosoma]|uniref:cystathionine gamma-synthase family protein n=1 Tax=unclassified Spirosoma TaxID=2621999 RepID=UPI00095F6F93|nr:MULTISPECIES: cystathionine gamma-synthase family protein [unclassified Spirosoma]MBN8823809.1 cystathionine gamma-synthase family protein [Spirosoma sp.]OJW79794.1 MAG: cystathionine gamma-synthase [Spirosoma sp. 48-14]
MDFSEYKKSTASVWAGETDLFTQGAVTPPIIKSVTFGYNDLDEWHRVATGNADGYIYSRNTNPTVHVLEEKIRILEGAEAATSFATGMGAISNTLFALLEPGKRVVSLKDTYGGASRLFLDFLPRYLVNVTLCDTTDFDAIETELAKGCDLLYLETPTNPTLKIVDLRRLAAAAKKVGAVTVVDNTFATPINQNPLALGADLVLHSATKFLCGHSDAMGGVLCGRKDLIQKVFQFREINGASLQADPAYLIARGMKTLELRIERQNASALTVAQYLKAHPKVSEVFYPGLESHPGHAIAKAQMSGFGGILSFSLTGGYEQVKQFLPRLQFVHLAASLGSVSTLAGPPRTTSHVELTEEQRSLLGIPESLIRYSVGIENVSDLITDLERALALV